MMLSSRTLNLLGFLMCAGMLSFALYLQHVVGLEPCPLCIFQRIAVMAAGLLFLVAFLHGAGAIGSRFHGVLTLGASLVGVGLALRHLWLQSLPADQVPSCGPGLDYMMDVLPVMQVFKEVLSGSGECAQVEGIFMGITLPGWTLMGFAVLALIALMNIVKFRR